MKGLDFALALLGAIAAALLPAGSAPTVELFITGRGQTLLVLLRDRRRR